MDYKEGESGENRRKNMEDMASVETAAKTGGTGTDVTPGLSEESAPDFEVKPSAYT